MSAADSPIGRSPEFAAPPLVEVALAVEFAPVAQFGAIAMADLARRWRDRYPIVQEHPPLPPSPALNGPRAQAGVLVSVGAPQIRVWLLTEEQDRLVQIQRDRLVVNWRAGAGDRPYPRYVESLRPEFVVDLEQLHDFFRERSIPTPRAVSTEVTYVNSLGRMEHLDLVDVLRSQAFVPHHLGRPAATQLAQTWSRTSNGAVTSTLTMTVDTDDAIPPVLTLTGRTAVRDGAEPLDVLHSLDVSHDDVVQSFVELTDERRQREWGRRL